MNAVKQDLSSEALELAKECLQLTRQTAYAGELQEHVSNLFGNRFYADNVLEFKTLSVWMAVALAKPKVRKALKEELKGMFNPLVKLFENLYSFCEAMEYDVFKIAADVYYLENYAHTADEKVIQRYFEAYAAKAAGLRATVAIKNQFETRKKPRA